MVRNAAFVLVLASFALGMELVGSLAGFTNAQNCFPFGDYLYLLDRFTLYVVDISDPTSPTLLDSLVMGGYVLDMSFSDGVAFVGCGNTIRVLDLSDPAHPVETFTTSLGPSDYVYSLAYEGGFLFVAATNVFAVYEFSPTDGLASVYSSPYMTQTVDACGGLAAIGVSGGGSSGIMVFDVSTPSSPALVGGMSTPGYAVDVDIDGDRIYLADGAEVGVGTGHVLLMLASDLHSEAGRFSSDEGDCRHGCAYGNQYVVANGYGGFILLDWTSPDAPAALDSYALPPGGYAQDANVQYPYIYGVTRNELLVLESFALVDTAGADLTPPVVELIEPVDGSYSACIDQPVRFVVRDDESGVDWSSVRLEVNGVTYTGDDLHVSGDTVSFAPMLEWHSGDTISYSLLFAADNAGNAAPELPISGTCVVDLDPPVVFSPSPSPGDTASPGDTVSVLVVDSISGVDPASLWMTINGSSVSPSEFLWDGSSLSYVLGGLPTGAVSVCAGAHDATTYCGPNASDDFCWSFYVRSAVADSVPPIVSPLEPLPETFTSCETMPIRFLISDESGVDSLSIELSVGDTTHSWGDPALSFAGDTLVFTPTEPYPEGVPIAVSLLSCCDLCGNCSTPVTFQFYADYTAPWVESVSPAAGSSISDPLPTIQAVVRENDGGAGVCASDIRMSVNGAEVVPEVMLTSYGAIVSYTVTDSLHDAEVVTVTLYGLHDSVDYCDPNEAEPYEWSFSVDLDGVCDAAKPESSRLSAAPNPFNASCTIQLELPRKEAGCLVAVDISGRKQTIFEGNAQSLKLRWMPPQGAPTGLYYIAWLGETTLVRKVAFVR